MGPSSTGKGGDIMSGRGGREENGM